MTAVRRYRPVLRSGPRPGHGPLQSRSQAPQRGADPEWYNAAVSVNSGPNGNASWSLSKSYLEKLGIHASETAWVGGAIDYTVWNNSSIDDLFDQIKNLVSDPLDAKAA